MTPSQVVALIRESYPTIQTNIGSSRDVPKMAAIVDGLEAIPERLIPPDVSAAFQTVRAKLRSAVRAWEGNGLNKVYLSGRDLIELLGILARCPDTAPATPIDSSAFDATAGQSPLIFISCGQFTSDEKSVGQALREIVERRTRYRAYFAEQQNTLDGLTSNILSAIAECSAFVAVAHQRGSVSTPKGSHVRASVWIEQEVAIAAFIQHALKRPLEVALYLEKGIHREGIREQLRLAPIEFETSDDILRDFEARVASWQLESRREYSLRTEWRFTTVRETRERHEYRFIVDLVNDGRVRVTDWRIRVRFPSQFLDVNTRASHTDFEMNSTDFSESAGRLYPGDRKPAVVDVPYAVDDLTHETISETEPAVEILVWSGDMRPIRKVVPMSKLNEF